MASWTRAKDLRAQVAQLWARGDLLASDLAEEPPFPRRLLLKKPSSAELSERFAEVRDWIAELQQLAELRLEMKPVRHRVLGQNLIPDAVWLDGLDPAVRLLGKQRELQQFRSLVASTRQRQPALLPWLQRQPLKALGLVPAWPRLLDVVAWLQAHPRPGIYLRQMDIPGVDTKFVEAHRGTLLELLDMCLPAECIDDSRRGASQFERRYFFKTKPLRLRFRIVDPDIRMLDGPDNDVTLSAADFCALQHSLWLQSIRQVFITENEINFLAFPPVAKSLVVFGAGYGFEQLTDIPWLQQRAIFYWGDIDTHGFAILDQLRSHLPQAHSLLMDEATLLAHKTSWGREPKPQIRALTRLTEAEQLLYRDLCDNRFGPQLRLEQERVNYRWLLRHLAEPTGGAV